MKEIIDIIHNTIYQFFDVCGDDEEVSMSEKDKLLLEVNKAICNNLKALEQHPCEDLAHSCMIVESIPSTHPNMPEFEEQAIHDVLRELRCRKGKWLLSKEQHHVEKTYECSECGMIIWGENELSKYCPNCGAKMGGNE